MHLHRPLRRPRPPLPLLAVLPFLSLVGATAVAGAGCTRDAGPGAAGAPAADAAATAPPLARAAAPLDAAAPPPSPGDVRAAEERASLADAGRSCGEKDLPDCPLQQWMKRNAATTIQFGETSALGDAFDQIAALAPPASLAAAYPYWVSISRDGADAARMGNIPAAQAACRGCHVQYTARYHAELRALPLPAAASGARP